ncbi:MAG TPA: hypothetical protein H9768_11950 [Candidatus Mailhella merdavium]|nr:hypothetical protein [Candidatus Mailhella merdavium]
MPAGLPPVPARSVRFTPLPEPALPTMPSALRAAAGGCANTFATPASRRSLASFDSGIMFKTAKL